jgi:hypothetical protein
MFKMLTGSAKWLWKKMGELPMKLRASNGEREASTTLTRDQSKQSNQRASLPNFKPSSLKHMQTQTEEETKFTNWDTDFLESLNCQLRYISSVRKQSILTSVSKEMMNPHQN